MYASVAAIAIVKIGKKLREKKISASFVEKFIKNFTPHFFLIFI